MFGHLAPPTGVCLAVSHGCLATECSPPAQVLSGSWRGAPLRRDPLRPPAQRSASSMPLIWLFHTYSNLANLRQNQLDYVVDLKFARSDMLKERVDLKNIGADTAENEHLGEERGELTGIVVRPASRRRRRPSSAAPRDSSRMRRSATGGEAVPIPGLRALGNVCRSHRVQLFH